MSKAVFYSAFTKDDAKTVADGIVLLGELVSPKFAEAAFGRNLAAYKDRPTSDETDFYFRITVETVQPGETE